ncbi:MAG: cobalt ECF transporter T component CbiQ [Xanthobacter sp.]
MAHLQARGQTAPVLANSMAGRAPASLLEGLDPRSRIVAATAFALVVVALHDLLALSLAVLAAGLVLLLARLPMARTLKRMVAMDGFVLFMLVLLPFTVPGEAMFSMFGYPASREGLLRAADIALKANAVVLMLLSLVGSMEPVRLGHALHRLYVPAALVHLLLFTVRYVDVLREEYERLRQAMKARGFRPRSNWHSYRSLGYLMGMMLVRAIERSERILGAMRCRGFRGQIPLLDDLALTWRDAAFVVVFVCGLASLCLLSLKGLA